MKSNMKLKPEDRSRALMLGGATVVVLIVGVGNAIHMLQSSPRNSHPASGTLTAASQTTPVTGEVPAPAPGLSNRFPGAIGAAPSSSGGSNGATALQGTGLDLYAYDRPEPLSTHDPFTPVVPLPPSNAPRNARTPARRSMDNAIITPMPPRSAGPAVYPGQTMPNSPRPVIDKASFMNTSGEPGGKSAEELSLGGVITGPSAVAVLHLGDRCYTVTAGERLPNQMVLVRVTDTGVYLTASPDASPRDHSAGRTWFLEIGKPLHSAIPIKSTAFNSTPVNAPAFGSTP